MPNKDLDLLVKKHKQRKEEERKKKENDFMLNEEDTELDTTQTMSDSDDFESMDGENMQKLEATSELNEENSYLNFEGKDLSEYEAEDLTNQIAALPGLNLITHINFSNTQLPKNFFSCFMKLLQEKLTNLTFLDIRNSSCPKENFLVFDQNYDFYSENEETKKAVPRSLLPNPSLFCLYNELDESLWNISQDFCRILRDHHTTLQTIEMDPISVGSNFFEGSPYLESNRLASGFFSSSDHSIEFIEKNRRNLEKINITRKLGIENPVQTMINFIHSKNTDFVSFIDKNSTENLNKNEISIRDGLLKQLEKKSTQVQEKIHDTKTPLRNKKVSWQDKENDRREENKKQGKEKS